MKRAVDRRHLRRNAAAAVEADFGGGMRGSWQPCAMAAICAALGANPANAACSPSMLTGKWLMVFIASKSSGQCVATNYYGCKITVGLNGDFSAESCSSPFDFIQIKPIGRLVINPKCHVTGSFSFSYLNYPQPHNYNIATLDMYLSADRTKVSGIGSGSYTGACESGDLAKVPVELISRQPRSVTP
jgi:hypothetical protein